MSGMNGIFDNAADAIDEAIWLADNISSPVAICDAGDIMMTVMPLSEADLASVYEIVRPDTRVGCNGEYRRSTDNANKEKQA